MNALRPKKALITAPAFHEYEQALRTFGTGCEIKKYYLYKDGNFDLDGNILEYITSDMDLVCICNPNNPTGRLTDKSLIIQIASRCKETGAWLFVDESFMELVKNGRKHSICGELDKLVNSGFDKIFVLKSFTKLFAMPGLRLGYGICADSKILGKIKENTQPWNVSVPSQLAGIAAIDELEKNRFDEISASDIAQERGKLFEDLSQFFKVYEGAANFLMLEYADEPYEGWLYEKCLENKILIRSCSNFEGLQKGWYRIAVRNFSDNRKLIEILHKIM
jgi:threonine-phosphate decarboxylase